MLGVLFSNNHKDIKNLGLTICSPLHNLLNNKNLQFSNKLFIFFIFIQPPKKCSFARKILIGHLYVDFEIFKLLIYCTLTQIKLKPARRKKINPGKKTLEKLYDILILRTFEEVWIKIDPPQPTQYTYIYSIEGWGGPFNRGERACTL